MGATGDTGPVGPTGPPATGFTETINFSGFIAGALTIPALGFGPALAVGVGQIIGTLTLPVLTPQPVTLPGITTSQLTAGAYTFKADAVITDITVMTDALLASITGLVSGATIHYEIWMSPTLGSSPPSPPIPPNGTSQTTQPYTVFIPNNSSLNTLLVAASGLVPAVQVASSGNQYVLAAPVKVSYGDKIIVVIYPSQPVAAAIAAVTVNLGCSVTIGIQYS
jgi:hypothetical protein